MQEQPNQVEKQALRAQNLVCSFLQKQLMGKESGVLFKKNHLPKSLSASSFHPPPISNFKKWGQNEDTMMTLLEMNGRKWISQISSQGFDFPRAGGVQRWRTRKRRKSRTRIQRMKIFKQMWKCEVWKTKTKALVEPDVCIFIVKIGENRSILSKRGWKVKA